MPDTSRPDTPPTDAAPAVPLDGPSLHPDARTRASSSGSLADGASLPPPSEEFTRHQTFVGSAGSVTSSGEIPIADMVERTASGTAKRYRLLRRHAHGGLGVIFLAEDIGLRRPVALKEIQVHHADDPRSRRRFVLEAEVTGRLQHPGIVPVHDLGTDEDGRPFYTMRFVEGETFADAIRRHHQGATDGKPRLTLRQLLRRFVDVCNAVAYAHSQGVIHRDIKPHNVLLGMFGESLVVDWGLAKVVGTREHPAPDDDAMPTTDPDLAIDSAEPSATPSPGSYTLPEFAATQMGAAIGTPGYMAPEQAAGRWDAVGPLSDVYSLGAMLSYLLTGRAPTRTAGNEQPPPPREVNPAVPVALDAVCRKAMAERPADRYAGVLELAADIEHWLADEPVAARPDGWMARLWRAGRRHPAVVAGTVAAVLVGLVALGGGVVMLSHTNTQLRAAGDVESDLRTIAERNRDRADEQFRQARRAVDEFFTEVSDSPRLLRKEPGTQALRKALLEKARAYYEKFVAERGADTSVRAEAAAASHRLAGIVHELAPGPKAHEHYERARSIRADLARESPTDTGPARDLAQTENDLGTLLVEQGKLPGALSMFESARAAREKVAAAHPDRPKDARELARTLNNIGFTHQARGKPADGLTPCREARTILERMAGPGDVDASELLGQVLNNIAWMEQLTGASDAALVTVAGARAVQEKLTHDHPTRLEYALELARTINNEAIMLAAKNRPNDARRAYEQARDIQERLVRENPDVVEFAQELAKTHNNLGAALRGLSRRRDAIAAFRQALALHKKLAADHKDLPEYALAVVRSHNNIGVVQRELGLHAEAVADLERARDLGQQLLKDHSAVAAHVDMLARALTNLGLTYRFAGRPADARAAYEAALPLRQRLAHDQPKVPAPHRELADVRIALACLGCATGDPQSALDRAAQALDGLTVAPLSPAATRPLRASAHRARAEGLSALGRPTEAKAELDKALADAVAAVSDPNTPADALSDLARVFAAAASAGGADADGHAAKAVATLKRAAGAYRTRALVGQLEVEEAFVVLKDRPDFRELIAALKSRATE